MAHNTRISNTSTLAQQGNRGSEMEVVATHRDLCPESSPEFIPTPPSYHMPPLLLPPHPTLVHFPHGGTQWPLYDTQPILASLSWGGY